MRKSSECCTVGLADVKLHGFKPDFFRCADGFPVWKGVKLQGSQTSKKSRSAVRKQNCMVLKQLVNLKYFEKIISNIQRFEGLEEGKITWYSNVDMELLYGKAGLEEDKITWCSNP